MAKKQSKFNVSLWGFENGKIISVYTAKAFAPKDLGDNQYDFRRLTKYIELKYPNFYRDGNLDKMKLTFFYKDKKLLTVPFRDIGTRITLYK